MRRAVLLVHPPIYDFAAYDFWLRPYGLLRVAGYLRGQADMQLFDFLDRWRPEAPPVPRATADAWGRGPFYAEVVRKPALFAAIPRHYRRYGIPRHYFQQFLADTGPYEVALIQTGMTYWYPGVREVIDDLRALWPQTLIVLGGVYATLCPRHAGGLGADLVVAGAQLTPLWRLLRLTPRRQEPPLWEAYDHSPVGMMQLTAGCPFRCTYCSVPQTSPLFTPRPLEHVCTEFEVLCRRGVRHVAFYDDALLFQPQRLLLPFLRYVQQRGSDIAFHTPNGVHARFVTREVARALVQAGVKTFYLGFESRAVAWQRHTGGKLGAEELVRAVEHLIDAGADSRQITAYLLLGHPQVEQQELEASMDFAHRLGLRLMLAEFSPLPGTPDGEACRRWVDLDEPLWHNKTVFPMRLLGRETVDRLKALCRQLNQQLAAIPRHAAVPPG